MAITALDMELSSVCSFDELNFQFYPKYNSIKNSIFCCGRNNQALCYESGTLPNSWNVSDNSALCIVTKSSNLKVIFSSDFMVTGKGFTFRYFPVGSSNMSIGGQYVRVDVGMPNYTFVFVVLRKLSYSKLLCID